MGKKKLIYFGLFVLISCSTRNNDDQIEGHWHCVESGHCEFETIDIKDSSIVTDKYIVGSYSHGLYIGQDVKVQTSEGKLSLNYAGTSFHFYRSDLRQCLLSDRYKNCMIDLSLPEVESALPFEISTNDYNTGDILIGKLRRGLNEASDELARQYPDSTFIQVDNLLVNYKDFPEYMRRLLDCMDCPRSNINLHVDKEVPEGVVDMVVRLINPGDNRSNIIHNVVKIRNGDIGLLRR